MKTIFLAESHLKTCGVAGSKRFSFMSAIKTITEGEIERKKSVKNITTYKKR